jgi:very-short-patch-repair endonuclease
MLPAPQYGAALHGFTADLYWPDHKLVVEVDSYGFHNGRWAYERDRRKDAVFHAHGITVRRFSRPQVLDTAVLVIAQIATHLATPSGAGG